MSGENDNKEDEGGLMWLDNDPACDPAEEANTGAEAQESDADTVRRLEDELVLAKKELAEVRKELAGKVGPCGAYAHF